MRTPLYLWLALIFAYTVFAGTDALMLATSQNALRSELPSNINLHNSRNTDVTAYGLYVRQLSQVNPDDTCDHAERIYPKTYTGVDLKPNITAGAFVMPMTVPAGKNMIIGSHYLYNMIYQALYYVYVSVTSSPPGCAIPGCTWPNDPTYHWCIQLGVLAPISISPGYTTANVPPSTIDASLPGLYDYNLVSQYVTIGPISCDDQALTCTVSPPNRSLLRSQPPGSLMQTY